ncbi:MAG TPA: AAA family ATPase [Candidatus Kryptonia bacterium]|nr:AAA family ATPase [Candidatus Kryptonia bacterium]
MRRPPPRRDPNAVALATSSPPFVGRQEQLEWLEARLADALAGRPQLVLLPGEIGIGKTRLLKELRRVALARGFQAYYGRCYEDLAFPYLPFVEVVQTQVLPLPDDVVRTLGSDAQVIGQLLRNQLATTNAAEPAGSDRDKLRLYLAVARATISRAHDHPILFVVDDLHWADRPSMDLLTHVVFALSDAAVREPVRFMIVAAYRPTPADQRLEYIVARLQREEICQTLDLPGLSHGEVDQLIEGLGLVHPAPELVDKVSHTTRGNPLFIREVMHHLIQRGDLRERSGRFVANVGAADLDLPDGIGAAVAAHARALSDHGRSVLALAALLGERFDIEMIAAISGMVRAPLLELLEEAIGQGVLLNEGQTFLFTHPLIRHAFAGDLSAARRQQVHAEIAGKLQAMETEGDERSQEIAHHLVAAGPMAPPQAVIHYGRRAGDQAFGVFAWEDAARYYEAALAASASSGRVADEERATLYYRAGLARYRAADVAQGLDHYEQAIAAFRRLADARGLAEALMERIRAAFTLASVAYGTLIDVEPLEAALAALAEREPVLRGRILCTLANVYWTARQSDKSEAMAQQALTIGEAVNDDRLCAEAAVGLALAHMQGLKIRAALERLQQALALARRVDDRWLVGWSLQRLPLALSALGRLAEADAIADEACALARETHDWGDSSLALAARVGIAVVRGDFDAAQEYAQEAIKMVRRSRYPWGGPLFLPALACGRFLRGSLAEAEDAIHALVEPGRVFDQPGPAMQASAWYYRQLLAAYAQPADAVRAELEANPRRARGRRRSDLDALAGLCALVEIADRVGDPQLADSCYPSLADAAEHGVVFSSGWIFLLPRVLGVAATLNGRWEIAEANFEAAVTVATEAGARPELARTYLDQARMLAARGDPEDRPRANQFLGRAVELFRALGMEWFVHRTAEVAATLGAELSEGPLPTRDELNPLDAQILREVARGRTEPEIGDELVMQPATVGSRVRAMLGLADGEIRESAAAYLRAKGVEVGPERRRAAGTPAYPGSLVHGQTLIIFFSDIVGSTTLIDRLGDAAARPLLRAHNRILRGCLARHGGTEIQHTGDGIFASFSSASSAIDAAIAIQRAFAQHNAEHDDTPIHVRIGLNAGEPVPEDGRLFGAAVNATARICARARADEILAAEVVHQIVAGKAVTFADRGHTKLKGFSKRFHLYEVKW